MTGPGMTIAEVLALPAAFDLSTAGRAFCLGRTKSHELARAGEFPCPVLRLGKSYRVTRTDLLRSLGIDPAAPPDMRKPGTAIPGSATDTGPSPKDHVEPRPEEVNIAYRTGKP
ncbi:MAG TPA: hypothetical protein VLW50_09895 [Streptosporangiaceae bacterium]|nr:hypothetical protein [Streptosporangiaceae bacterium]